MGALDYMGWKLLIPAVSSCDSIVYGCHSATVIAEAHLATHFPASYPVPGFALFYHHTKSCVTLDSIHFILSQSQEAILNQKSQVEGI